ncbi:histidinol dehydrogenase [Roseimicrobium sp. ORNL1]|uniref:histidinol dehydrogenase n=1 Tax=Roseimicrobium sp. ORNL1 TaxID=2711231 RepID=UPI0013E1AF7D|nr:histidinol dehydrogenase [Roseimicrobium sp. ORNL1]QIF02589.1 histidinol dehydrogenase [Roseimicrobium sp. ORNL1]
MRIIRYTDAEYANESRRLDRRAEASDRVREVVSSVIKDIRERGDAALLELTKKFDGADLTPDTLAIPLAEAEMAIDALEPRVREALEASKRNVQTFAQQSMRKAWSMTNEQGAEVGEVFHPFERVGVYVPGGTAPLVSTAIMTVAIAAAAGVPEIVVCSPCGKDGQVNPNLLAALRLAGATEIYRVGGSQAIAAMAFGTETIKPVTKIFGPGNSYVVEAKRQAFGVVSIDLLPGPSEVLVLADKSANPAFIAADLLAQAEHGKDSGAGFLTDDAALLEAVLKEVETQGAKLSRQDMVRSVLDKECFLMLVPTLEEGAEIVNNYAPEHLSLITEREQDILPLIRTAGAIFLGNYSPVAVGDFLAGPSHTLPTGGAGKSFPGLTVDMFQRRTSMVRLSKEACAKSEPVVRIFSEIEGLDAHGNSVTVRSV